MQRFTLSVLAPDQSPACQWGSILHGMLMEKLPSDWGDKLHTSMVHPFSQYVEVTGHGTFLWHLHALDDCLGDIIAGILHGDWESKKLGTTFHLGEVTREIVSPAEFMKPFFLSRQPPNGLVLNFQTPSTHKVQGRYAIFPSAELIGQSLASRFCSIEPTFALGDPEVLEQVVSHTRISRYRLQSTTYGLESSWVTGYIGRLELHFDGPDALCRLAGVLYSLADWCGVGIKTALGMGGCVTSPLPDRKKYERNIVI